MPTSYCSFDAAAWTNGSAFVTRSARLEVPSERSHRVTLWMIAVGTAIASGPPRRSQRARQRTGLLPWVLASKRAVGHG